MNLDDLIREIAPRIAELRRDIHAHPELAFAETRTADLVAKRLEALGIEVHRGLARTGVVGRLRCGTGKRTIGLRADMDALPLDEANEFGHRSQTAGRMHACGHDGHTAMLLGAAEALARTRAFDGTVYFIFQPAEEHEGGGRVMVEEGLFERFPMERVFGLHNWPDLPAGSFGILDGPVMAGADRFEVAISGRGCHAAMPHRGDDVVLAGAALVQSIQSLVSRTLDPLAPAVVSVTRFQAGQADNILPEHAVLGGTIRHFDAQVQAVLEAGMDRVCKGIAAAHGVKVDLRIERGYPPTINSAEPARLCRAAALEIAGAGRVLSDLKPSMGAEDFAFLSAKVPGCYAWLGSGKENGGRLHSPRFDFNDEVIPAGIRYWVRIAETALPKT